jgi:DNA-binding NarL/FixJ family response regulator
MHSAPRLVPVVVDEIAFQTRRNLAQRALADIIPFRREDEDAIREGARALAAGRAPDLPPRHLVSAAHYALAHGRVAPRQLARAVVSQLNEAPAAQAAAPPSPPRLRLAA